MSAAQDFRRVSTPEDVMTVAADLPAGYPVDAMECALLRADAVLVLLSGQFDGTGSGQLLADNIIADALWSVRGQLAAVRKLLEHGYNTEGQQTAEGGAQ